MGRHSHWKQLGKYLGEDKEPVRRDDGEVWVRKTMMAYVYEHVVNNFDRIYPHEQY